MEGSRTPGQAFAGTAGRWLPALLLLLALLFNGSRGLWAPDEGRYVVGAMEMLRRGDFVGIFLNDDTAHFTKPPLTYWSIAAAMAAFGQSEFAARLPNALAFVATALLLLPAGRLLTPGAPALPMIVYATMALPFLAAGFITTDTLTALFTTLAGVAFLHLQAGIAPRRAALALWIGFGFAFLAKGPPTLLALPVFVGWLIVHRDRQALRNLLLSPGLPLFAVIAFGWFLLAERRFPGLLHYLLGAEVAGRVASTEFQRNGSWYGGFTVYLPTLLVGCLPWWPAWLVLGRRGKLAPAIAGPGDRLLLLWIAVPLLVFMLARSRLPLYVLPLFAPIALWLARRFEPFASRLAPGRQAALVAACFALLMGSKLTIAQLSPVGHDSRVTAALIEKLLPGGVHEIVYVDQRALWELRFYLGAQVHESWLRRRPYEPTYRPSRTLSDLVSAGDSHKVRLYVVNPRSSSEFALALSAHGLCPDVLARDSVVIFYRATPLIGRACARPQGS